MTDERINPRTVIMSLGIKDMWEAKVYPLSLSDQVKLSERISAALQVYFATVPESDTRNEMTVISFLVQFVKDNISLVLRMIVEPRNPPWWWNVPLLKTRRGKYLLDNMDTEQVSEIVQVVYEVNFEDISKKLLGLFEKASKLFPSGRPQPMSSKNTLPTE